MKFSLSDEFGGGAYSCVFFRRNEGAVYKVFKSQNHRERVFESLNNYDEYARKVFQDEVEAHKIARDHDSLRRYVPEFLGTETVESITDKYGGDISHQFLLDCCYKMALVDGTPVKMLCAISINSDVQLIREEFEGFGIGYLEDASVFFPDDLCKLKIIDFSVNDPQGYRSHGNNN